MKLCPKCHRSSVLQQTQDKWGPADYRLCGECLYLETIALVSKADARIRVLEGAIRQHRDERKHERCWIDDPRLYAVLDEPLDPKDFELPPREEWMARCAAYHALRQPPREA